MYGLNIGFCKTITKLWYPLMHSAYYGFMTQKLFIRIFIETLQY